MKSFLHRYFFLLMACLLIFPAINAQQRQISQAAKKKEQVERHYKKAYAKARKRTIKHRYDIQTAATKEMMDAAEKRAKAYNKRNDPNFLERIFKRKRPRNR